MMIEPLWREHHAAEFPAVCRGRDIDGIDFVMLEADVAGCVLTFLKRRGALDLRRTAILGVCYRNVTYVLPKMPTEARPYFERVERLARLVLDAVKTASGPEGDGRPPAADR
jgi:hypothetical protein